MIMYNVAFFRGINVGRHHKVPMASLTETLQQLNFENIITILNSGNMVFEAHNDNSNALENALQSSLKIPSNFPFQQ